MIFLFTPQEELIELCEFKEAKTPGRENYHCIYSNRINITSTAKYTRILIMHTLVT